jgi:hypothetical protein
VGVIGKHRTADPQSDYDQHSPHDRSILPGSDCIDRPGNTISASAASIIHLPAAGTSTDQAVSHRAATARIAEHP